MSMETEPSRSSAILPSVMPPFRNSSLPCRKQPVYSGQGRRGWLNKNCQDITGTKGKQDLPNSPQDSKNDFVPVVQGQGGCQQLFGPALNVNEPKREHQASSQLFGVLPLKSLFTQSCQWVCVSAGLWAGTINSILEIQWFFWVFFPSF